mmetsp:Transcript_41188/g.68818  ORF Transcript_41188/g.68818 Transcript_41188/m.68818 type:complete len:125 (-) Transcript_41188:1301-1675(-)
MFHNHCPLPLFEAPIRETKNTMQSLDNEAEEQRCRMINMETPYAGIKLGKILCVLLNEEETHHDQIRNDDKKENLSPGQILCSNSNFRFHSVVYIRYLCEQFRLDCNTLFNAIIMLQRIESRFA